MAVRLTPSGPQSIADPNPFKSNSSSRSSAESEKLKAQRLSCEAKGGRWDEVNKTCILLEGATTVKTKPSAPVVGKTDTGQITNITRPDGKTLITAGLSRTEARDLAERQAGIHAPVAGTISREEWNEQRQEAEAQAKLQQQLTKIGEIQGVVGREEGLDISQALTAGVVGEIPSTLKTAGTFAAGGALLGTKAGAALAPATAGLSIPAGAAIGAGIGVAVGIWSGIQKNMEKQQKGQVKSHVERYNVALRGLRTTAMLATTYPGAADKLVEDFNQQKYLIHQAYADIKAETDDDLEKYIEDGTEILAKFDAVTDKDTGLISIYELRLELALSKGVPMDDLALALEEAEIHLE